MIGNDLIYLPHWPHRQADRLERYRQKTFLPQEQVFIKNSSNFYFTEALLWSAKEAVYKIWARYYKQKRYNPKNFAINLPKLPQNFINLRYTASSLCDLNPLNFTITSHLRYNYLFTWATLADKPIAIESLNSLIFKERQVQLDYQGQSWPIKKNAINAPFLLVKGQVVELSLSHDGMAFWYLWQA